MNMENSGWFKLHRSFLEWEWYSDVPSSRLFLHLLLKVNWEEKKWQGKTILPGQLVTSIGHLSQETGLTEMEVRNRLKKFQESGEITKQTTNKFTIITLLNWSKYQGSEGETNAVEQTNNNQTTNKQQPNTKQTTNKHQQLKNIKKERKKELNKHIPLAKAADNVQNSIFSFSEPEQVSAVQMMDSLARWERLTKVWVTQESLVVLKTVRDKYFLKLPPSVQEEVVQYVESLSGFESKFLSNLWIGPLLKSNNFSIEHIRLEIEQKKKYDRTRPKSLKQESADEPFVNHNYDENGRLKSTKYNIKKIN